MNMRWAWTLPVLTTVAIGLVAAQARAQGGPAPPWAGAPGMAGTSGMTTPQQAAYGFDPAMMAAMQAQAAPGMYAPPAGYQSASMFMPAGAFPQGPMYQPSPYPVQPVAYMAGAQVPGPVPGGPMPDVYGSYGSVPTQYGPPGGGAGAYGPPGYGPEAYGQPMQGAPGYGAPGYGAPGNGGPMYDGQMGMGGPCQHCGGQGCDNCRGGIFGHGRHGGDGCWMPNGLLGDVLGCVAPYPDGGCAAPRWFDFAVDYMMMKRDNTGRNLALTSDGILGPIVLETDDLDFGGYRSGFRFTAAMQMAAANSLEFNYFGQFHYTSSATVRSPNDNLFSVISDFGFFPPFGFEETDNSDFQQIRYISQFDSFEINWRCRWMAPNCRYQGSWSLGVRHFILDEKFRYDTSSSLNGVLTPNGFLPARARFDVDTTNNLTGLQVGTDLWICLLPGLRAGGELQAGVYGNHMNVNTTIGTNQQVGPDFIERLDTNDVSFIGQANLLLTYRINYQWTLRGGYQFLFVEGVALAPENFNTAPPELFVQNTDRVPFTDDDGNVFYHGWNVGLEFMW